jgi:hypothetical protein
VALVHTEAGKGTQGSASKARFLPLNKTIASEGGDVLLAPGVTTLGLGSQTSVSSGFSAAGVRAVCRSVL